MPKNLVNNMIELEKKKVADEIELVIHSCEQALLLPDAYKPLPTMIGILRHMHDDLTLNPVAKRLARDSRANGLVRIATDGVDFQDSELASMIFNVMNRYLAVPED